MTTATANPIAKINQDIQDKGLGTLGYLVWWSMEGVEVLQADLVAMVESLGLNKSWCPAIEARGGIVKALESLGLRATPQAGKKSTTDDSIRLFYDRIQEDENVIVTVVNERVVFNFAGKNQVEYKEQQRITYTRATKSVTCATSFMDQEILDAFTKYTQTYRANEVRLVLMRALAAAKTVTVRASGGVYFAPETARDVVVKLQSLARAIPGVHITALGLVDTEESRQEMAQAASDEIKAELAKAAQDLLVLGGKAADGTKMREGTLQARIEDYKALREKALCYKDLVSLDVQEIEEALASLTEQVKSLF